MKQNVSPKSIIAAMVLMLLMVVCSNANAQVQNRVINFTAIEDSASCWQHLRTNPTDTLRLVKTEVKDNDSTVVTISVFMNGDRPCKSYNKDVTHRVEEQVPVLDSLTIAYLNEKIRENRRIVDAIMNKDLRYDLIYGQVDEPARSFLIGEGKFVKGVGRKDGLNVGCLGTFQTGDGITAVSGKAGVMYFHGSAKHKLRYLVPVLVGATAARYSDLAEDFAGDLYMRFTAESGLYLQPFTFDGMDQLRLFFGPGIKFNWYQSGVQSHVENGITHKVSSWGLAITGVVGMYLTYRPKCEPWNFVLGMNVYQSPEIRLNEDCRRPVVVSVEVGITYNLGRGFQSF